MQSVDPGFAALGMPVAESQRIMQVCPKYLDVCFVITYGVTLILSYTIADSFVHRWLQVITQGGVFALITVCSSIPLAHTVLLLTAV